MRHPRLTPRSIRLVLVSAAVAAVLASLAVATLSYGTEATGPSTGQAAPTVTPSAASASEAPSIPGPVPTPASASEAPASPGPVPTPASPTPAPTSPVAPEGDLTALVAALPVAEEHRDGYERDLFRMWTDEDDDGCDTRREVLLAEAVSAPAVGPGCQLTGGRWISVYDEVSVTDASSLDIDHVIPLAEAWDSGARSWTPNERADFANDLDVPTSLIAVTASSNRSKGDRDPAEWMPPVDAYACTYVTDWVSVKTRWNLSVDPVERQALESIATECLA